MDIAIEGGEVVPRSIGESRRPHQLLWDSRRKIANIPIAAYGGETPVHLAQKIRSKLPNIIPIVQRPTPVKDVLKNLFSRVG